jgi:predicted transglutaminase-like cysteine proteinase
MPVDWEPEQAVARETAQKRGRSEPPLSSRVACARRSGNHPLAGTAGAWVYQAVPAATDEPFASTSIDAPEIPLAEQWRSVWAEIQSDIAALSLCGAQQGRCSSAASIRFGKILESARGRDGLIKLAMINAGVNAAIRYAGIQPVRVEYPWSSAAAIFTTQRGSCMEFAIAKYIALLQSEWPSNDIRLVLAWPDGAGQPHMVLAARYEARWYILDNLRSAVLTDTRLENYVPLFVLDHLGVRKLVPEFIATDSARGMLARTRTADE